MFLHSHAYVAVDKGTLTHCHVDDAFRAWLVQTPACRRRHVAALVGSVILALGRHVGAYIGLLGVDQVSST